MHTLYPAAAARADYESLLSLVSSLESHCVPLHPIAYDESVLESHATPAPASALDAAPALASALAGMNSRLRSENASVSSALAQQTNQARTAAKDLKIAKERMRQGDVALQAASEAAQGRVFGL